ncbi:hypothetical protein RCL1_003672 [Eukaryota sp. TZLM3-RCL]
MDPSKHPGIRLPHMTTSTPSHQIGQSQFLDPTRNRPQAVISPYNNPHFSAPPQHFGYPAHSSPYGTSVLSPQSVQDPTLSRGMAQFPPQVQQQNIQDYRLPMYSSHQSPYQQQSSPYAQRPVQPAPSLPAHLMPPSFMQQQPQQQKPTTYPSPYMQHTPQALAPPQYQLPFLSPAAQKPAKSTPKSTRGRGRKNGGTGRGRQPKGEPKFDYIDFDEADDSPPPLESEDEFAAPFEETPSVASGRSRRATAKKSKYREDDSSDESFLEQIYAPPKSVKRQGTTAEEFKEVVEEEEEVDGVTSSEPVIDRIFIHRVKDNVSIPFVCERREALLMKSFDPLFSVDSDDKFKSPITREVENSLENIPEEFDLRILKQDDLLEFYVKWKGWSMSYATWEPAEVLKTNRSGQVRLQRYLKMKRDEAELLQTAADEDREEFLIKWELANDFLTEYTKVEAILDKRKIPVEHFSDLGKAETVTDADGRSFVVDYLVKWREMDEEDCTWERVTSEKDKIIGFVEAINEYESFITKPLELRVPPLVKQRVMYQFRGYPVQPKWITHGELRDYQLTGLNFLLTSWVKGRNVILADEMGLGKTIQTAVFLGALRNDFKQGGPSLIIVPLSTIHAWQKELKQWAPNLHVILYYGSARARSVIKAHRLLTPTNDYFQQSDANSTSSLAVSNVNHFNAEYFRTQFASGAKPKFHCILTTYEMLLKDQDILKQFNFHMLIVDEAHRLKNDKSKLADCLDSFQIQSKLLLTGTPLQNSLRELWNLLNFLDPIKFADWNAFHYQYGDLSSENQVSNLHEELNPYILRRLKKDVEKGIPGKIERIIRVELSPVQKKYYKWILSRNFDQLKKGSNINNLLNIMVELKKICNHPYLAMDQTMRDRIFAEKGIDLSRTNQLQTLVECSGKVMLLDRLLSKLHQRGSKVLIFSQMVRMLDILSEYMYYKNYKFQRLDGSMKAIERKKSMERFNAPDSEYFVFLLSTRAGGLGINLTAADVVVIFDSDWNPQNDLQAEARAHRIGQKKVVKIFRVVSKDSVEEEVLERAKKKLVLDHVVIQSLSHSSKVELDPKKATQTIFDKNDINQILKFGAKELFTENEDEAETKVEERLRFNDDEIDRILNLEEGSIIEQEQSLSETQQFLNKFEFSDFSSKPQVEEQGGFDDANFWKNLITADTRDSLGGLEGPVASLPRSRPRGTTRGVVDEEEPIISRRDEVYYEPSDNEFEDTTPGRGKLVGGKIAQRDMKHIFRAFRTLPSFTRMIEVTALSGIPKSEGLVSKVCEELVEVCEAAVARTGKDISKIGSLNIEWRGIKSINAADLIRRMNDLETISKFLVKFLEIEFLLYADLSDPSVSERLVTAIPDSTLIFSQPSWSATWQHVDDLRLLVAIYRIGFGNWEAFRKEQTLGLTDKLGSIKTPFLSRRMEALVKKIEAFLDPDSVNVASTLKGKTSKTMSKTTSVSSKRKSRKDEATPPVKKTRASIKQEEEAQVQEGAQVFSEQWCKDSLSSVSRELQRSALRATSGEPPSTALVSNIGQTIEDTVFSEDYASFGEDGREQLRVRLWKYVSNFCNSDVDTLRGIYERDEDSSNASAEEE